MKQVLRKALAAFAWFIGFCALLAFFGGILAYVLSEGTSPEERGRASEVLVESWGNRYIASIMALSAVFTIIGMLSKKLPGLRVAEGRPAGHSPQ